MLIKRPVAKCIEPRIQDNETCDIMYSHVGLPRFSKHSEIDGYLHVLSMP